MKRLNDQEFDRLLTEQLAEPPEGLRPEDSDSLRADPWSRPIEDIVSGLALTTLHLNFLWLQYILPTVGALMLYNGLRSLRGVNRWFRAAWLLSALGLANQAVSLFLAVTPFGASWSEGLTAGVGLTMTAVQIVFFLLFRQGLRAVCAGAEAKQTRDPVLWLAVWEGVGALAAFSSFSESWLVVLPLVIWYIAILYSLYQSGKELGDAGYRLENAPVMVDSAMVRRVYLTGCLLIVVIGCAASNHLWIKGEAFAAPAETAGRQALIEQGFPAELLADLPEEEAELLYGALAVEVNRETEDFDNYVGTLDSNPYHLGMTTVFVEKPGNVFYVLNAFAWQKGSACWQDGFTMFYLDYELETELAGGALLWERGGQALTAPIPRLRQETVMTASFFGTLESSVIRGAVGFPFGAKRQRGYVLYRQTATGEYGGQSVGFSTSAGFNYVHYGHPFHIPYMQTEQRMVDGSMTFSDRRVQIYSSYDNLAYQALIAENEAVQKSSP